MNDTTWLNAGLGFLEGIGLIASPCILPILPLILSGSLTGGRRRPLGIIAGFVIFFALFTFFSRALVQHAGLNPDLIRQVSYGILILLGIIMLSGTLTEKFLLLTGKLMGIGSNWSVVNKPDGGFVGGMLFGGLTAVIWTPCAGPILAAVIVQTALQQAGWGSFLTILAFAIGAGLPMLAIAFFGRSILMRAGFLKTHSSLLRKSLGAIIILAVIWMIYGESTQASSLEIAVSKPAVVGRLENGLSHPYPAPEMAGIQMWLNSKPLQIRALRGKVVLVDFWTYSCINCIRTLPYVKDWYRKYHDKGLVVIGVHTPEFEFEKDPQNVADAVKRDGILYPVALDSQYQTWQNFHNRYWPAHYLIDKKGNVVYQVFGEGDYDVTENNIRYLLGLSGSTGQKTVSTDGFNPDETPETYFGLARMEHFAGTTDLQNGKTVSYEWPSEILVNGWALSGKWMALTDRIVAESAGAALRLHFNARKVFLVMGSLDGQPVPVTIVFRGKKTMLTVKENRLYDAVQLSEAGSDVVEVQAGRPGLEIYTATFGE